MKCSATGRNSEIETIISTPGTHYLTLMLPLPVGSHFAIAPAQAMNRFTTVLIERFLSVAIFTGQFAFGRSTGSIFEP